MAIVVVASCIPWLRHQELFSVLVGITAVALVGFMAHRSFRTLSSWHTLWQSRPAHSKWRIPISRKHLWGWVIVLVLTLTLPHFAMVFGGDYKLAVATAHKSRQFNEALGAPVREGWFSEGKGTLEKPIRSAMLIPVRGKKGKGNLRVQAAKDDGIWRLTKLTLELEGSSKPLDLLSK